VIERVAPASKPMLSVNNIEVIYDHVVLVLKGVSLEVPEGGITALLGANGAGKTTTLKAISNLLRAERGDVTKGSIEYRGERVDRLAPHELVRRGCVQVMEGRHCFAHRVQLFPPSQGAAKGPSRLHLRRRAADVRHRPGTAVKTAHDPAR
jgi:branched-chain amino acid transport system ATP-binding protein